MKKNKMTAKEKKAHIHRANKKRKRLARGRVQQLCNNESSQKHGRPKSMPINPLGTLI